jgi:uncharacterized protein (DUF885 family)
MKNQRFVFVSFILVMMLGLTGCGKSAPPLETTPVPASPEDLFEGLDFDAFVDQSYKMLAGRDPENAIALGISDYVGTPKDRLTDISDAYIHETQALETSVYDTLKTYDRSVLSAKQQLMFDIYDWYLDDLVRSHPFMYNTYLITPTLNSFAMMLQYFFTDYAPVVTETDAVNYVALLSQVDTKFEQLINDLDLHKERGVILPAFLFDYVTPDISALAISSPSSNMYYQIIQQKITAIPGLSDEKKQNLLDSAYAEIKDTVIPAYKSFLTYVENLSNEADNTIGAWSLPDGDAYYAYTIRHNTTTDLTPDEIFNIGMNDLEKINMRMREIFSELGYPEGESLVNLYRRVATEGGMVFGTDIKATYEQLIRDAQETSSALFHLTPAAPVIVKADPMGGFYMPPSMDGSRPGIFFAMVEGAMPRYEMPSLAYHEAVPGHHFQLALSGEMDLPLFQKVIELNGYVEGWALYAERLMWEHGAYENDPYGELGYLQMQARRAARLVIDTGIHSKHWGYDQAVNFMSEHAGYGTNTSNYEVTRSVVWPGQETSYYIGYIKILELRQRMMDALGDAFDLKAFHDLVLGSGPVPLTILEKIVNETIAENQ